MVTHAKDVADYADKIIYLEDGKITPPNLPLSREENKRKKPQKKLK